MSEITKITLTPTVEKFYNEDTNYGIYIFKTHDKLEHFNGLIEDFEKDLYIATVLGNMQRLTIGVDYECTAIYEYNSKYKTHQYKSINIKPIKPITIEEQRKFLENIISKKQANVLLFTYPNIIEMIINGDEVDLSKTKGIKEKTFGHIKDRVLSCFGDMDLINMLKPYGVTDSMIAKLKQKYSNTELLRDKLFNNPYILTSIKGFGFKKVDKLAMEINPEVRNSRFRALAFVNHTLNEVANGDGHTRVKLDKLDKLASSTIPDCLMAYNELIEEVKIDNSYITIKDGYVGLTKNLLTETIIYEKLNELEQSTPLIDASKIDLELVYKTFYENRGYHLTDEQKEIVSAFINHNVVLLTGSGGTGKSSCIYAIHLALRQLEDVKVGQCALSAKAAQRISETTGAASNTIHRLLGATKDGFTYNEEFTMPHNVIIIDEASMININIFRHLVVAINNGSKLIIVFDDAQLPPIGAGNVATDLLLSKFKKIQLTKVHRQAAASGILSDANQIRLGINPIPRPERSLVRGELQDQFYMFRDDTQEMFDLAIKYYMKSLETLSVDDIVICIPRKSNAKISTLAFNTKIQDMLLGHESQYIKYGETIFKLGAKVIQRENNPVLGVFNGDIGYVSKINQQDKKYCVDFSGREVEFDISNMASMELAYSLTCHLLQGSEYNTVITVLSNDSYILLSKEMTYTAITRAKKRGLVIAQPKAFNYGCKKKASKRITWLQTLV